jgi:hypothetical protein
MDSVIRDAEQPNRLVGVEVEIAEVVVNLLEALVTTSTRQV